MKQAVWGGLLIALWGLLMPAHAWAQALENPPDGSKVSGISIISGWKCTAGTLTFTIDNGPPGTLVYGVSRADTQLACSDTNNGFITEWNWGLTGPGLHTIRVFDDGVEFAEATFTVTTFGTPFLSGATGTYLLSDFPRPGANTTVEWQEQLQNFVITGTSPPSGSSSGGSSTSSSSSSSSTGGTSTSSGGTSTSSSSSSSSSGGSSASSSTGGTSTSSSSGGTSTSSSSSGGTSTSSSSGGTSTSSSGSTSSSSGGGGGPFAGAYQVSATKTSDTCNLTQTSITDTLTVTQNGANITGTFLAAPTVQYAGTVDASGNFTLTQTAPISQTKGLCFFEIRSSFSGNFNSGSVAGTASSRKTGGTCPPSVNCDASFSGTLTKTSTAPSETFGPMSFDEGSSVDELLNALSE
jgi:hypothetical protein